MVSVQGAGCECSQYEAIAGHPNPLLASSDQQWFDDRMDSSSKSWDTSTERFFAQFAQQPAQAAAPATGGNGPTHAPQQPSHQQAQAPGMPMQPHHFMQPMQHQQQAQQANAWLSSAAYVHASTAAAPARAQQPAQAHGASPVQQQQLPLNLSPAQRQMLLQHLQRLQQQQLQQPPPQPQQWQVSPAPPQQLRPPAQPPHHLPPHDWQRPMQQHGGSLHHDTSSHAAAAPPHLQPAGLWSSADSPHQASEPQRSQLQALQENGHGSGTWQITQSGSSQPCALRCRCFLRRS